MLCNGMSQIAVENICRWAPGSPMVASYVRAVAAGVSLDEFRHKMA